jgi:wyosine [tRNA(Phe)-imidazoG37] synthetase (radical SAM superfamily)
VSSSNGLSEIRYDRSSLVLGPVDSRRFGRSLGVNPLPAGSRFCNFDCVYCECATSSWPLQFELKPQFPEPDDIRRALAAAADACQPGDFDAITIAGNGEPTLSPHLGEIVDVVTEARDRDWPWARTVILTNGTTCHRPAVRAALAKLDERVVKLDAGTGWILDQMNRPSGRLSISELLHRIAMLPEIVIQSMFIHGPVDNTRPEHVEVWTESLARLKPLGVQIYSLDRIPAKPWARQVPPAELQSIARYAESRVCIPVHVY